MPFVQNTPSGGAAGVSEVSDPVEIVADEDSDPSEVFLDNVRTFELPDDDTKGVVANFILPRNIDLSVDPSMMIEFFISSTGSGNGNVRFRTTARYIAVGETTAKAADETVSQTEAAVNVVKRAHQASITLDRTLLAQADFVNLLIERLGADVLDTYDGDIAVATRGRFDFSR